MKKITYAVILILALTVTACGSRPSSNSSNFASATQNGMNTRTLPIATQLAIGTLKLDKTANDVTADQAAKLLPLWETMQLLETSDTAAKQEVDALSTQIQETLTEQQVQAITAMNLTRQDMFAILQTQGGGTGTNRQFGNATQGGNSSDNETNRNRNFGGSGFVPGAGGPPDGGGFGGGQGFGGQGSGGQNRSASQIATAQARQATIGNRTPAPLINALIEFLKKKAGP